MIAFRTAFIFVVSLCLGQAWAQTRHALVIGNDSYPGNSLQNARNDARGVFNALNGAGYSSTLVLDASRSTLSDKIDAFADSIHAGDTALLYYAGHGMQVDGENFLIPIDFNLTTEATAKQQGYSLSTILERLTSHGATTQVVVLDACRDNPFMGSRSMRGGWAGMGTSAGSFLAFGTSPGSTASDDPTDDHGLFTHSLLRYLTTSNLDIEDMFRKVREDVIRNSAGKQVPWVSSSLIGSFHINPALDENSPLLQAVPLSEDQSATHGRSLEIQLGGDDQVSPDERALLLQATSLARGERLDKAIGILKGILSLDPRCAIALRLLGLMFHATGRDVQAVDTFDRAISVSGADPRAAAYKCAVEAYMSVTSAATDCGAVIHAQPSSDGYLAYAGALAAGGDQDQAYTNATQAIVSGGGDLAYALRGSIARRQGQPGLAERDMTRAVQLSTQSSER